MIEKIGTVRNPLTIIAIFAGIAEVSGTGILPFIKDQNQFVYILFLVAFPTVLVLLFFATLNFNHHVRYAPSDFKDEGNYFKGFKSASYAEKVAKLQQEVNESELEIKTAMTADRETKIIGSAEHSRLREDRPSTEPAARHTILARYTLAEELVLARLSKEYSQSFQRDVSFQLPGRTQIIFDGVLEQGGRYTIVEIKYIENLSFRSVSFRIRETVYRIAGAIQGLPATVRENFALIIAIATDDKKAIGRS